MTKTIKFKEYLSYSFHDTGIKIILVFIQELLSLKNHSNKAENFVLTRGGNSFFYWLSLLNAFRKGISFEKYSSKSWNSCVALRKLLCNEWKLNIT
jgi:hypothetical protein